MNFIAALFLFGSVAIAQNQQDLCTRLMKVDGTSSLIAYFSMLLENRIIKEDVEVVKFIEGLEKGILINPILEKDTWVSSASYIHHEEIQNYINSTDINENKILAWAKSILKERLRVQVKRKETRTETENIHQKIELNFVPAGEFEMIYWGHKSIFKLTNSFEMMSTLVTQKMWAEEMKVNPAKFTKGAHMTSVNINGKLITMQPDNPVENITWWSAVVFANRVSEKMGLVPAYDISEIKFKPNTSAEKGTLDPEEDYYGFKLKINAPNGDIYLAEGYRLPTEAEMQYVLLNLGDKTSQVYPRIITESDLADYAWYRDNSGGTTHPVATTAKSFVIGGGDYHDLLGNVKEWGHDSLAGAFKSSDNPVGIEYSTIRSTEGGGWDDYNKAMLSYQSNYWNAGFRGDFVGFRLVRTIKNNGKN
ncbi:MAG: hypothetical protein A2Z20_03500 [Bdellovibrionales bacterium RBG_16_40_8]|nr:MAG: hypothetical protein A2Z20_03500 [Bdellovibrionales bacterium RBG_16_40_8]